MFTKKFIRPSVSVCQKRLSFLPFTLLWNSDDPLGVFRSHGSYRVPEPFIFELPIVHLLWMLFLKFYHDDLFGVAEGINRDCQVVSHCSGLFIQAFTPEIASVVH